MNIPCASCSRLFGGHETYKRHLLAREDRCRTEGEMRARGMFSDAFGVWRRAVPVKAPEQSALIDRRTVPRGTRRHALSDSVAPLPGLGVADV